METNNKYSKYISEVWVIKEKIYHETEKMDFKQYSDYLDKNIKDLKVRFKKKYALKEAIAQTLSNTI
jgi:hypothetical protein